MGNILKVVAKALAIPAGI